MNRVKVMAVRSALAPLLNRTTVLSIGLGFGLVFLMPFAMRIWIRIMQISPSGALATIGLVLGLSIAAGSFIWFLVDATGQAKIRRLNPGMPAKPFPFWHFPAHMFGLYLIALPTAICLAILRSESPTAADWARNEDRFVEATWSVALNRRQAPPVPTQSH